MSAKIKSEIVEYLRATAALKDLIFAGDPDDPDSIDAEAADPDKGWFHAYRVGTHTHHI